MRKLLAISILLAACGRVAPVEDASDDQDDPTTDPDQDVLDDWSSDCPAVQIPFEAEEMDLTGFSVRTSSRPSIGDYIEPYGDSGEAFIELSIDCEDDYVLWGLAWWESGSSDSFYYRWGTTSDRLVWDIMQQGCYPDLTRNWYWDHVSRRIEDGACGDPDEDPDVFHLTEGTHTFRLHPREPESSVAEFILTNMRGFTPPGP
jgi:hypothetical protein